MLAIIDVFGYERHQMSDYEVSSGNVFADLELPDANEMLAKSRLVAEISNIISSYGWTQQKTADVLGMEQPALSKMLHGHFHEISEAELQQHRSRLAR